MINGIENRATTNEQTDNSEFSERRLWAAVLLQAVEDWRSGSVRKRRAAEKFFFESEKDFEVVCRGAGFEPSCIVAKLRKMHPVSQQPLSPAVWATTAEQPVAMAA